MAVDGVIWVRPLPAPAVRMLPLFFFTEVRYWDVLLVGSDGMSSPVMP
jgi:hypothetical protein